MDDNARVITRKVFMAVAIIILVNWVLQYYVFIENLWVPFVPITVLYVLLAVVCGKAASTGDERFWYSLLSVASGLLALAAVLQLLGLYTPYLDWITDLDWIIHIVAFAFFVLLTVVTIRTLLAYGWDRYSVAGAIALTAFVPTAIIFLLSFGTGGQIGFASTGLESHFELLFVTITFLLFVGVPDFLIEWASVAAVTGDYEHRARLSRTSALITSSLTAVLTFFILAGPMPVLESLGTGEAFMLPPLIILFTWIPHGIISFFTIQRVYPLPFNETLMLWLKKMLVSLGLSALMLGVLAFMAYLWFVALIHSIY